MMTILFRKKTSISRLGLGREYRWYLAAPSQRVTLHALVSFKCYLQSTLPVFSFLSLSRISWPIPFVDFNHLALSNSSFPWTLVRSLLPYLIEYNCSSRTAPSSLVLAQRRNSLSDRAWLPCNFPRPFLKDTVSPSSRPPLSLHPVSDKTMSIFGWLYSDGVKVDLIISNF